MLSAYETETETAVDLPASADKSDETSSNISQCLPLEKHADSDCLKLPSSSFNLSERLSLRSESVTKENNIRVRAYFGSTEPTLRLLPQLPHELIPRPAATFPEFYIKQEPSPPFAFIQDSTASEPSVAASYVSDGSEQNQASCLFRSFSPLSESSEGDAAKAPVSDLYIVESDTQDFILSQNVHAREIKCAECQPLPETEEKKTHNDPETHTLMCDSSEAAKKCHHSLSEDRVTVASESDAGHCTGLRPPAADACEVSLMSVNDEELEKAEVTGLTPQERRSDSPAELWLDAYQYLTGEDTEDRTGLPVMQGALSETSGSSRVSGYNNPEGSTGIGWCDEDSGGWGPPVERWSSVDSWASALSDWAAIITAPPEDLTAAFTEIGAEIDALTQALAEVHADKDTETSEEAEGQQTSLQTRPQPPMGVQDQPLMTQNIPESCVLSGQSCVSLCLEPAGPELQRQRAEHLCDSTASKAEGREPEEIQSSPGESPLRPSQRHSSTGLSSAPVASPGGYSVDAPLIPGATPSADVTLSQSGGYVESLETDIVLNIIEDTDLEGQNPPAELIIGEPSGAGLREVTEEHIISQPGTLSEQEWRRCSEPAKLDGEGTNSSADPDRPPTHTLENLHVPGVNAQPVYVHAQVLPDTLLELDGARQLEPQLESPEFIMPLAPLLCRTSSSLEGDQICAKRSPTDKRDLCCDHVQPCILWPTLDVITDKPPVKFNEELIHKEENTFDSSTEKQLDLQSRKTSECHFTDRKTIIEEIHEFSRELSNLAAVPADHFIISEKDHVAFITLDLNDPFTQSVATTVPSEKAELSQKTAETMPHKTDKNASEGKTRSKKDKSAGHHHHHHHHHGTQASKKQENLSHHVSAQQTCKQLEIHPPTGENHTSETASAGLEDNQAKSGIETCVPSEKAPNKPHGKKKKKHGQNAAAPKSVTEPPAEVVNGAKPKTAKGRIDMFEAKLGAKAEKAHKESGQKDAAERKSEQPEAKVSKKEGPAHQTEHRKDQQPKNSTSPLKDDAIKRRRLSEDKFGKIVSALESKVPKTNVSTKAKATDSKTEAGAIHKKPYSEVVKQKLLPKADPKVVQPIQAVSVSGDPQSLCLWCQFAAVLSDYAVIWSRDATVLTEIKRSAGDESRVSLTISNASHKDLGKYQCRLSSSHGSVSLEYLLTYEVLSEIVIPPSPKTIPSAPEVEVGRDEEDVHCSKLMFKEDFLADQYFGENHPVSISTEKIHFGEGMHRRAFRTKLQAGQMHLLVPGHSCVLKVHNSISYGTKNNEELIQKNFTLAVEECQVQNTARQYIKAYTAAAQSVEAFGDVPEIIPIYLVHRPSNDIPYATLEEELIGDFVKYSVKDGKEINLLRRDSEAGQKCCAFQHWVYHNTEGNLLVTDMQGVGMRLTDVGIATCKKGYKGFKGNCATSFIDQFKALHQCNTYCEILGLKSLQPKAKKPAPKPKPQPSAAPKKKIFGPTVKGKS